MAVAAADKEEAQRDVRVLVGMWIFVISDAVGFTALLSTMMALGGGASAGLPTSMWISVPLLALTSGGLALASWRGSTPFARAALLGALAFVAVQIIGLASVFDVGFLGRSPAEERLIVVVLVHLVHAVGGLGFLASAVLRRRSSIAAISVYWHYLSLLYLVIVGLFYVS